MYTRYYNKDLNPKAFSKDLQDDSSQRIICLVHAYQCSFLICEIAMHALNRRNSFLVYVELQGCKVRTFIK